MVAPLLSAAACHLDDELKRYFERRIVTALGEGFPVVKDPVSTSPVPGQVVRFFAGGDFVDLSRAIATHLFNCQSGATSPGLLTVVAGTVEDRACIALLKLEKQSGVRLTRLGPPGHETFDIEQVKELIFTDETRVFKVGLFPSCDGEEALAGLVCDTQRGNRPGTHVAAFFLGSFLGCTLAEAPDTTTQSFFSASQDYFNTQVQDPAVRARYEIALLAEMGSESNRVRPRAFAESALRVRDRDPYLAALKEANAPVHQFQKDIALIASQIGRLSVLFESGVKISGSREGFERSVTIREDDQGTLAVVRGNVERIRGG